MFDCVCSDTNVLGFWMVFLFRDFEGLFVMAADCCIDILDDIFSLRLAVVL